MKKGIFSLYCISVPPGLSRWLGRRNLLQGRSPAPASQDQTRGLRRGPGPVLAVNLDLCHGSQSNHWPNSRKAA